MKQPSEYRQNAQECRKLGQNARNEHERQQLARMAEAWERMARDREQKTAEDPATAQAHNIGPTGPQ